MTTSAGVIQAFSEHRSRGWATRSCFVSEFFGKERSFLPFFCLSLRTQQEETKLFVSSLSSYFRSAKRIKRRPSSMSSFHDGVKAKFEPSQIKNKVGETGIVEQTLLVRGCLAAQPARPILTPPLSLLSLPPLPLRHHDSILSSLVLPLLLL